MLVQRQIQWIRLERAFSVDGIGRVTVSKTTNVNPAPYLKTDRECTKTVFVELASQEISCILDPISFLSGCVS